MLELCKSLLFAVHLLCMNLAAGGPLICIWLEWRQSRKNDCVAGKTGRFLATASLAAFLLGSAGGLAVGWIMWILGEQEFFATLQRMPAKIIFGLWELFFYLVCMAIYIAWWKLSSRPKLWQRLGHRIVAILAATDLLYHFPPLFAVISQVSVYSPGASETIDAAIFRSVMYSPVILSRTLHFWLAAIATSGILVMVYTWRKKENFPESQILVEGVVIGGGRFALLATLLQLPVGMWVLLASSPLAKGRLMGGDWIGCLLFVSSVFLAMGLMHQLAAISLGQVSSKGIRLSLAYLLWIVIFMTGTLQRAERIEGKRPPSPLARETVEIHTKNPPLNRLVLMSKKDL